MARGGRASDKKKKGFERRKNSEFPLVKGQNFCQLQYLRTKIGIDYNFQDTERPNHLEYVCSLYNASPPIFQKIYKEFCYKFQTRPFSESMRLLIAHHLLNDHAETWQNDKRMAKFMFINALHRNQNIHAIPSLQVSRWKNPEVQSSHFTLE
ncbi:hypothetical protein Csa_015460 [Cucumis sativus]|nr:hypothetical protein Csa_015460 [Cucumis sativus]